MVIVFTMCTIAEAGQGATRVFKFSVRIPETIHNTRRGLRTEAKGQGFIATKEIRDSRIVMVQTTVAK